MKVGKGSVARGPGSGAQGLKWLEKSDKTITRQYTQMLKAVTHAHARAHTHTHLHSPFLVLLNTSTRSFEIRIL